MLVLTRELNETAELKIAAGTLLTEDLHISVNVLRVCGNKVRIGFDASQVVTIVRGELLTAREADAG